MAELRYKIRGYWNGELVVIGDCTGVMAYSIAKHLLVENFAGLKAREQIERQGFTLDKVQSIQLGVVTEFEVKDETGEAWVNIQREW